MGHNGSPEEFWGGAHKSLLRSPKGFLLRVNLYPLPRSREPRPDRYPVSRETLMSDRHARGMHSHIGLDEFPDDVSREFPSDVRQALIARSRAGAALRLYRRRGWNDTAVRWQFDRAAAALAIALDRWEDRETNPTLF